MLLLLMVLSLAFGADSVESAPEVIVIGAGASGLAAARALTDAGQYKVTVLEARPNRYGGRIWTNTESFQNATDRGMDMGASFIHHPDENNAIVKLHQQFNLPMLDWNNTRWAVVRENDSMPYNQARVDAASAKVDKAFEDVLNLSSTLQRDVSVYTALRHLHQYQLIDDPLSQTFVAEQEFFYGSTINYLSAKYLFDGYMENEAPDTPDKIPAFGYTKMLDRIIQSSPDDTPLNILLDHEVTEVNVQEDKRVIIKCRNGQIYEADAVIVTLPLGVLKANDVKFTPDLSRKKKGAIKRVGFGTINKFALEFSHRLWSKDTQQMTVAPQDIADRGKFSILITFHSVANKPVVMTYAVSQFGEDSERLSDKELKDIALRRLRTAFGPVVDLVSVVNTSRTKWKSDPFSKGSYSFPALGIKAGDWGTLGEAEPPLFFAGEHTQSKQYGTVLSAIETGRKAATEANTYLKFGIVAPVKVSASYVLLCSLLSPIIKCSL